MSIDICTRTDWKNICNDEEDEPVQELVISWCFTALSAQIGYIMPWKKEMYHIGPE